MIQRIRERRLGADYHGRWLNQFAPHSSEHAPVLINKREIPWLLAVSETNKSESNQVLAAEIEQGIKLDKSQCPLI